MPLAVAVPVAEPRVAPQRAESMAVGLPAGVGAGSRAPLGEAAVAVPAAPDGQADPVLAPADRLVVWKSAALELASALLEPAAPFAAALEPDQLAG